MAGHTYRLTVEGELSERLAPAFEGMELAPGNGNTALTGYVRDQSQLQALLRRVTDLGLTLLEAKAVDEVGEPGAAAVTENHGHERVGLNKSKGR
jgi:hypothetical protein